MTTDRLIIFDTTLRDGEQSAGASMTPDEKLKIALQLETLGVDIIEAGFPISSEGDFFAVNEIAKQVTESTVCGLSRAEEKDIRRAGDAIAPAKRGRIHTFIATSPVHMEKKLRMSRQQVLERAVRAVEIAKEYTDDVEFSPEDAGRSDIDFLCEVVSAAIAAGASTINIPDTVGYNVPTQFGELIRRLRERVDGADGVIFSAHCHNDLGMAVANSLAALSAGARQIECTINGIGERAGNTALEEVVMAVRTRRDYFGCDSRINTKHLLATSRMVSSITGFVIQPNKAIVGANAFAHESGIHQDGVLKSKETYEIMRAEDIGWQSNVLRLGKLSGRNALRDRFEKLGFTFGEDELKEIFKKFKTLADKKNDIYDEDLIALVASHDADADGGWRLESFSSATAIGESPSATVSLSSNGESQTHTATGDGQIDAAFKGIEEIIESGAVLQLYSVRNITDGSDSQGEVSVRLNREGVTVTGTGCDTDIVIASVYAYIDAVNRLSRASRRIHPQHRQI